MDYLRELASWEQWLLSSFRLRELIKSSCLADQQSGTG
jgi:hypothetical protein